MHPHYLIASLLCAAQALIFPSPPPAYAENLAPTLAESERSPSAPSDQSTPVPRLEPVVEVIRSKLAEADLREIVHKDDLAALAAFYENRSNAPLWMTDMGLSANGQQALFEIERANDWGLDKDAFDLPPSEALPAGPEEQAISEIKLSIAILKYARFARGGRFDPAELSRKVYQTPPVLDPNTVMTEIATAEASDAYLRSLHPKHDQFVRLREALLRGREEAADKSKAAPQDIKRIIINMERWRWMPEDLGDIHVLSNAPAFMLYVVKYGRVIHEDKTQVGALNYATPLLSDNMTEIVFNPEWIVPPTAIREDLLPMLRNKRYTTLKKSGLSVSYRGKAVDPEKIDWTKANVLAYTFIQKPGPNNKLGKVKFRLPNEHAFILHDTWPDRRKYFQQPTRAIGYDCVRMEKPALLAKVILAELNQMPASEVEDLWNHGFNSRVEIESAIPVHSAYFTAVVDPSGRISTHPDIYGLDHKLARVMFGDSKDFPMPMPKAKRSRAVSRYVHRPAPSSDFVRSVQGLPGGQ